MSMIQGIDGGSLLNALRAGRQDRMVQDELEAKRAEADRMRARQDQIGGLMGQLFERQPQGIAAQAMPQAGQPIGGQEAGLAGTAPQQAPAGPQGQQARRPNPEVMAQLIALDPEIGGQIATAFKTMGDADIKAMEAKNTIMGAAAQKLMTVPPQERGQVLQMILPQLMEAGWTQEEIAQGDLSDQGLQMLQATAIDLDSLVDNELAEREFQAGKVTPVQQNGMLIRTMPDGSSEIIAAPAGYQGGGGDVPAEAVAALRRGEGSPEQFDEMFGAGASARVLGGGGGNATGGFPSADY